MRRARFWLRWSWRDLRSRWLLVIAISLTIAFGTGMFTGLGSMETWRKSSNDASFELLRAHDLKVTLAEGSYARGGELAAAVRAIRGMPVTGTEERLVVPTQVDASRGGRTVLVPGELVGIDVTAGGRGIDRVSAARGRPLGRGDATRPVAVAEAGFADENGVEPGAPVRIAGGGALRVVGAGTSPEYFLVTRSGGGEFGGAEARFAVLFVPIAVARRAIARPRAVNRLLVTLPPGADPEAAAARLQRALAARLPRLGPTVETLADEPAHRVLYKDAEGDQRIYGVFSWLILAGAAFAAFNLASRVVEAQRRELGVGMALGVEPRGLALRPMLLGAQIALLGVVLGVVLGLVVGIPLRGALEDLLPLPVVETPFETAVFVRGAAIGFLLPLLATALPVWRAVRVPPIEAIRIGFRSAKGSGLAPALRRVRLPGRSLGQLPPREILRAPRRTAMTALGIAAVVAVLVALFGLFDSIAATVDSSERQIAGDHPERVEVTLDRFRRVDSPAVAALARDPAVRAAEPQVVVPARVGSGGEAFDVSLRLVDPRSELWRPRPTAGGLAAGRPGVLLSETAADDLDVEVGDRVTLVHPRRVGPAAFATERTRVRVVGLHPDPFRAGVYMDASQARLLGLAGHANRVQALPAPGHGAGDVQRALFGTRGVVSVERATATAQLMDERLDDFLGILRVVEAFALLLALLIAFNSSSINADERGRAHATMFAFGVPVWTVALLAVAEGLLVGVAATALGLLVGLGLTHWVVHGVVPDTFPDLGVATHLGGGSLATVALLGIAAVALAPLLTVRKMSRMDIPGTLRIVE